MPDRSMDEIVERVARAFHYWMFVARRGFDRGMAHQNPKRLQALPRMRRVPMAEHVRRDDPIELQLGDGGMHRALQGVGEQVIAHSFAAGGGF